MTSELGVRPDSLAGLRSGDAQSESIESFWVSLKYFNFYRIAVSAVFLLAVVMYGDLLNLGSHSIRLFLYVSAGYLGVAVIFQAAMRKWPTYFDLQLSVHVLADIVALILMMYASGGFRSGIGVMLLISLAGAALVSRGILMLFYAAIASIALLLEQSYWVLVHDATTANFLQPGLLSIGYFATALITNQLAQRVIRNERVARQRGIELANQLRINQLVIQDVQDGILVVDSNGLVQQQNPAVATLLGRAAPELDQIEMYSAELAGRLTAWRVGRPDYSQTMKMGESGRNVRTRFVNVGVDGGSFTLVFLEDQSRLEEQAQQLKLVALGRLTANIAHEIRNPLSAVTHAGDLLIDIGGDAQTLRLVNIIRDNVNRLDRMVRDVLELSRRDRAKRREMDLREVIESFVREFSQIEGIDDGVLTIDISAGAKVEVDPVHFNQIIWNLVRNAWRHCAKKEGSISIRVIRRGNGLEMHVIDDGSGVPPELQSQLFEPFFTTYSSGTGLGLYIARELCAANGASLDYVDVHNGADFRVLWPLTPT